MEYIELLGVDTPFYKFKLIQFLTSVPSSYSKDEIKLLLDELINGKKIRFEFDLPTSKIMDFVTGLIKHGFLIGDSSINEER